MQRRSARLKEKPPPSYAPEHDIDVDMDTEDDQHESLNSDSPPAETRIETKRRGHKRKSGASSHVYGDSEEVEQQPKPKKLRGNRGVLQYFLDMPTDILFEVLGILEPLDLLSLARTTKSLRAVLMSKTSLSVWIRSFNNIVPTPPECPEDLSYPEYAEFAFGKSCNVCQRNLGWSCLHTGWRARVRVCSRCLGDKTIFIEDKHLASVVCNDYPVEIAQLLPAVPSQNTSGYRQKTILHFLRRSHDAWRLEYRDLKSAAEKTAWVESKLEEAKTALDNSVKYITWTVAWEKMSRKQMSLVIDKRKALVTEKLKEMGWEDELAKISQEAEKPEEHGLIFKVYQKEVTPRVLHNLEPRLTLIMTIVKSRRLTQERARFLKTRILCLEAINENYVSKLPPGAFSPTSTDLYSDVTVKAILNDQTTGDDQLSENQCKTIMNEFPEVIQRWHLGAEEALLEILATTCSKPDSPAFDYDPTTVLQLATTFFYCGSCGIFSTSEQVKKHSCTRKELGGCHLTADLLTIKTTMKQLPWNTNKLIIVRIPVLKQLADVLEECGFDPKKTTVEDMTKLDPIFECLEHSHERSGRCTMGWHNLCKHLHSITHSGLGAGKRTFIVLGDEEAAGVRRRMIENQERYFAKCRLIISICVHCKHKDTVFGQLQHVRKEHDISRPSMGVDLVLLPDAYVPEQSFMLWPPRDPEDITALREAAT